MRSILSLLIIAFIFISNQISAQDCTFYFPQKVGTTLVTKHYKGKDKLTGTTKTVVTEQSASSVKFSSEFSDDKGKVLSSGDYVVKCKNGEFVLDMSSIMNGMNMNSYKDMQVKIETDEMSIPAKLQVGQQLNNGEVRINISNQGFTMMKMTVKIINRKVEAFEDITTPAGTFKCAKISYEVDTKSIVNVHTKGVDWISQTAGVVRSESFDVKDKPLSYSVLTSLTEK